MAGPWERYQSPEPAQPEQGPWARYQSLPEAPPPQAAAPAEQPSQWELVKRGLGVIASEPSQIFNVGPARAAKEAVKTAVDISSLPSEVYRGEVDPRSDEAIQRSFQGAALLSPVNPAVRAGDFALPGMAKSLVRERPAAPTTEALQAATDAGYNRARGLGVDYRSAAVADMGRAAQQSLEQDGVLANLAPKTHDILRQLQAAPADSVAPLTGLEAARRALGHAAKDFQNPTEQMAAKRAQTAIDDFMAAGDPRTVVAGPAAEAARTITEARGNAAAGFRSDRLTGAEEAADLRAAVANSGQNGDNALRQRIANILLDPKKRAGFNEEELAALEGVARGSGTANTARFVGNLLGGGGGLGAGFTGMSGAMAGAAAGGPLMAVAGAGLPAVGFASKKLGGLLTQRAFDAAERLTRERSPLFEQMMRDAPLVAPNVPAAQNLTLRGLLSDYDRRR